MEIVTSASLLELAKLVKCEQPTNAPIAFAIYKLLKDAKIADDDIQNIGEMLTGIASGE